MGLTHQHVLSYNPKIATCDTDWNDRPLQPQVMKTVTVETFDVDYDEPETL